MHAGERDNVAESSIPHELSAKTSHNRSGPREHADDETSGKSQRVDYLAEPRYRKREPQLTNHQDIFMKHLGSITEFLFNEPRPYFPTFSGKHDE